MATSDGRPDAARSRPFQNWMTAEQYHWLLRLKHIPSVYSMLPLPKPASGQRPGPSLLSKSTSMALDVKLMLVIVAVCGQLPTSGGLSTKSAFRGSNEMKVNENTFENALVIPVGASLTWTRQ